MSTPKELLWSLRPSAGSKCTFIYDAEGKFIALMSEAAQGDAEKIVEDHNARVRYAGTHAPSK